MNERINRQDDEILYQPRIHSRWIRELYILKEETGLPMTVLIDMALGAFVEEYERDTRHSQEGEIN